MALFEDFDILFNEFSTGEGVDVYTPDIPSRPTEDISEVGDFDALFDELTTPVEVPITPKAPQVTPKGVKGREVITEPIQRFSRQQGLDSSLVMALTEQESAYDPQARSKVGATGLMQIMPATGKEIAKELGIKDYDLTDPETNIKFGTYYLKKMMDRYGGDVDKALAAYNAGPGNVDKYNGIPPFEETQNYVKKIKERQGKFTDLGKGESTEFDTLFNELTIEEPLEFKDVETGRTFETKEELLQSLNERIKGATRGSKPMLGKIVGPPVKGFRQVVRAAFSVDALVTRLLSDQHDSMIKNATEKLKTEDNPLERKRLKRMLRNAESQSKQLKKSIKTTEDIRSSEALEDVDFKQAESFVGKLAQDVGQAAPQVFSSIAMSPAGPVAGVAALSTIMAGSQIEELEEAGVDDKKIAEATAINAPIQGILEYGVGKLLIKAAQKFGAGKIVQGIVEGASEGVEEILQQFPEAITSAWAKSGKPFWEVTKKVLSDPKTYTDAFYAGLVGMILGEGTITVSGTVNLLSDKNAKSKLSKGIIENTEINDTKVANEIAQHVIDNKTGVIGVAEEIRDITVAQVVNNTLKQSPEITQKINERRAEQGVESFETAEDLRTFLEQNEDIVSEIEIFAEQQTQEITDDTPQDIEEKVTPTEQVKFIDIDESLPLNEQINEFKEKAQEAIRAEEEFVTERNTQFMKDQIEVLEQLDTDEQRLQWISDNAKEFRQKWVESHKKIEQQVEKKKVKRERREQKLKRYGEDVAKVQLSKTSKEVKKSLVDFAKRNLTQSQEKQIVEVAEEIKKADNTDPNYKKMNELIREFEVQRDIKDAQSRFNRIDRKKNIIKKSKDLQRVHTELTETFGSLEDFTTLNRLDQRGLVRRPFKKGTKTLSEMSDRYKRLVEKGFIDPEHTKDGETFYKVTPKGRKELGVLREDFDKNIDIIDTKVREFELKVKDKKDEISGKKAEREAKLKKQVDRGKKVIKDFAKTRVIKNEKLRKAVNYNQSIGEHSAGRIDGFYDVDDFGIQQGPLTENIVDPMNEGFNQAEDYRHNAQQEVLQSIEKEGEKLGKKIDISKMSETMYYGILDRTLGVAAKIPVLKRILDGKVGKTRVKRKTYNLTNGTIKLNAAERIPIYLYSLNINARNHLTEMGIKREKSDTPLSLTAQDIETIAQDVRNNPEELAVARSIFKFFNGTQKQALQDLYQKRFGTDFPFENNYFPLIVADSALQKLTEGSFSISQFNNFTTESDNFLRESTPGFARERVRSGKPIIIQDVFETLANNVSLVSKYVGYSEELANATNYLENIKEDLLESGLEGEYNTMRDFLESFMGKGARDGGSIIRTMAGMYSVGVLGLPNLKVGLKQVPSVISAMPYFDKRAAKVSKTTEKELQTTAEEVSKHSPYLRARRGTTFEADIIAQFNEREALNFIKSKKSMKDYLGAHGLMSFVRYMDSLAIHQIWNMAKNEVSVLRPDVRKGSQEYWDLVNRKTNFVVRQTQPNFSRHLRTRAQKNLFLKPFTWFSTQLITYNRQIEKSISILRSDKASDKLKRHAKLELMSIALTQMILIPTIDYLWSWLRGKVDEDSELWNAGKLIIRSLSGMVPYVSKVADTVINAAEGRFYEIKTPGYQALNDALKLLAKASTSVFRDAKNTRKRMSRKQKARQLQSDLRQIEKTLSGYGVTAGSFRPYFEIYENLANKKPREKRKRRR